jgi:hypothetical protein
MAFFGRSRSSGSFLAAVGAFVRPLCPAASALALRLRVSSRRSSPPFDSRRLYSQGGGTDNQELKDWLTFLSRAHLMNKEDVAAEIKTPAVLQAFELAEISKLPAEVRASYEAQVNEFDRYSQQTAEEISKATKTAKLEGILEGKIEVAQMMMKVGRPLNEIQECTGLSSADIEGIKSMGS